MSLLVAMKETTWENESPAQQAHIRNFFRKYTVGEIGDPIRWREIEDHEILWCVLNFNDQEIDVKADKITQQKIDVLKNQLNDPEIIVEFTNNTKQVLLEAGLEHLPAREMP